MGFSAACQDIRACSLAMRIGMRIRFREAPFVLEAVFQPRKLKLPTGKSTV